MENLKSVKKGVHYIVVDYPQSNSTYNGMVLEALSDTRASAPGFKIIDMAGTNTGYNNGSTLNMNLKYITILSRPKRAEFMNTRAGELEKEAKTLRKDAANLLKFKDDEEETAFKLQAIFDKKGDVSAIADILRELKATNLL